MKIIISPAKQIHRDADFPATHEPEFLNEACELHTCLSNLSYEDLQNLWQCNQKIADQAHFDLTHGSPENGQLPALLAYNGIQFKYMAPGIFSDGEWAYVDEHLRILSGFYGTVRPLDGIIPYRLEMQAKLKVASSRHLYDYWGDKLYRSLYRDNKLIINLASKEYSDAVEPYLQPGDRWIDVTFGVMVDGKIKVKATWAKMARGEMVRYMAENAIKKPEGMKDFTGLDYIYEESHSSPNHFVFVRRP